MRVNIDNNLLRHFANAVAFHLRNPQGVAFNTLDGKMLFRLVSRVLQGKVVRYSVCPSGQSRHAMMYAASCPAVPTDAELQRFVAKILFMWRPTQAEMFDVITRYRWGIECLGAPPALDLYKTWFKLNAVRFRYSGKYGHMCIIPAPTRV